MKILLMGLANAGKTSIAKNVFEGKSFEELTALKPTEFIETNEYNYRQMIKVNIFDLGGQSQFFDAYKSNPAFKDKIFSKVDLFIWVIDSSDEKGIMNSVDELGNCYKLLEMNSPDAAKHFHVLLHKADKKKIDMRNTKQLIKQKVSSSAKIDYYSTSIKTTSARLRVKGILDPLIEEVMGGRIAKLQDVLSKLNKKIQSTVSILFNSEYGMDIASAFEKYLNVEKTEFLEYISLKLVAPPYLEQTLKQFKKQGFLKDDKSNFSVYQVQDDLICIANLHKTVSLFTISSLDSIIRISNGIEKFTPEILAILKLK